MAKKKVSRVSKARFLISIGLEYKRALKDLPAGERSAFLKLVRVAEKLAAEHNKLIHAAFKARRTDKAEFKRGMQRARKIESKIDRALSKANNFVSKRFDKAWKSLDKASKRSDSKKVKRATKRKVSKKSRRK